ncbi:adenylate/guanylate cyclase domain-containing protein [Ruegeria arenilitoris]|uniref:adenylate/guanylate cyclase domain-containing protein n=1 Tax=Ruegeria arenilitoris TaxID=1173585 RepID=UPI00147D385B|nr:adenylate/guanylate cyclase domain-containing protein [Ruegeria arenilitoris]
MSEVDRKLTTILATDVVAFTNMMSRDEPGALHALKNCLGQIVDCIREHNGRVFGGAGDSLIAEFSSPSSAVKCAVDFQNKIAARNRDSLKQQRMWFRVGINLGDVMIDGDNLYGEGVNIASRLEELREKHPSLSGLTKRPIMFGRTTKRLHFEEAFEAIGLRS